MSFFIFVQQPKENCPPITVEKARQLFEFNTNHLSLSDYHHQTVLKTSKQLVAQHLMPNATDNLSQHFLMNYKANNNYLGFQASIVDFFTDSAVANFSSSYVYESQEKIIRLPKPTKISTALSTCIIKRRSHRQFSDRQMPLQDLSNILYYACGVSSQASIRDGASDKITLRNCASGGGLYPIHLVFYARNISKLIDGFYEYLPYQHALRCYRHSSEENVRDFAEYGAINAENCNIIIIYVYHYIKNTRKYGNQATAYAFIESGEIAQNIQLTATALTYGSIDIGGYNKEYLQELLDLDGLGEHVIHMTLVGTKESQ